MADLGLQSPAAVPGVADAAFWRGRRVLVTGHTGFKGAWLTSILQRWGADVAGIALAPETTPSLFALMAPWCGLDSRLLDIRDRAALRHAMADIDPEIVFHLAAQAIVRRSFREPVETIASNVMGTVHILDALAAAPRLRATLLITSDKVYRNSDADEAFDEDAPLGGDDPYSASKACCEIVAHAWAASGLVPPQVRMATVRAGNVLGGGDFARDRLICDAVRAVEAGQPLELRAPDATRPWQHVLDASRAYLLYGQRLIEGAKVPSSLNIGPPAGSRHTVAETIATFTTALATELRVEITRAPQPPEKTYLSLEPTRAAEALGWRQHLGFERTIAWTAAWYAAVLRDPHCARTVTEQQIDVYFEEVACREPSSPAAAVPRR